MANKLKILMLCDHPLSTSGVGTQARWLIQGLLATDRYTFRVLGGAMKHEDHQTVAVNDDFIIKPVDGFGTQDMLRQYVAVEHPDIVLLFQDPRFFTWVWEMEDEIHQVCPIAYNHLWDNPPSPEFNNVLYESTDLINCINWPTYTMVSKRFPDRANYIPHAVPEELYRPLPPGDTMQWKMQLLGEQRKDHFIALYVSRNARRKQPGDILVSWQMFLDELQRKYGHHNASLIMHTDPFDKEGPNLLAQVEMLGIKQHVIFSKDRTGFNEMNVIYNSSDVVLNKSCNEGFGLSLLEAKMCEKPIIAIKTGGMSRQVEDHETGEEYGVALTPEISSLVGNQLVPYIYEDYVSNKTFANAIMKIYELGPEQRAAIGKRCRAHALKHYNMQNLISEWDRTLSDLATKRIENKHEQRWEISEL